jgi:hypothetical protein
VCAIKTKNLKIKLGTGFGLFAKVGPLCDE